MTTTGRVLEADPGREPDPDPRLRERLCLVTGSKSFMLGAYRTTPWPQWPRATRTEAVWAWRASQSGSSGTRAGRGRSGTATDCTSGLGGWDWSRKSAAFSRVEMLGAGRAWRSIWTVTGGVSQGYVLDAMPARPGSWAEAATSVGSRWAASPRRKSMVWRVWRYEMSRTGGREPRGVDALRESTMRMERRRKSRVWTRGRGTEMAVGKVREPFCTVSVLTGMGARGTERREERLTWPVEGPSGWKAVESFSTPAGLTVFFSKSLRYTASEISSSYKSSLKSTVRTPMTCSPNSLSWKALMTTVCSSGIPINWN
jgi:hypothetical protein